MKITIDLNDPTFQKTISDAVNEKICKIIADDLDKHIKEAIEKIDRDITDRVDAACNRYIAENVENEATSKGFYNYRQWIIRQFLDAVKVVAEKQFVDVFKSK